jgi:hypothetical protein
MRTTFMHYLTEQQVRDVKRLLEELDAQKPNPNDGIDPQAFEAGLKRVLGVEVLPIPLPPTPFCVNVE